MATTVQTPDDNPRSGGSMSLLDHLLEFRKRVTIMAIAVMAGMIVFFVPAVGFATIEFLKEPALTENPDFKLQAIAPMENIVAYFRIALLGGLALGMPVVVYQTLRFVDPALDGGERKWVYPIAFGASVAFVVGLAFAYYVVLRFAFGFLGKFGADFAEINWTITNYIDLTTRLLLIMGFVFETPILVMGLAKMRIVSARMLIGFWRYAIVGAFAFSAVATPTPDPIVQSLVAGPMVALYFVGIGLAWLVRRD
ncbi:MAG TPA: twin-arginine translocase subunit TatC [Dehalococcoidia bacterium]|nr:twin-arginine translocase subunit TatC [Dehalococcoidia bacterium]